MSVGLSAFLCLGVQAATVSARSPSQADVAKAVADANNGDTILIPAGTATWSSTLRVSKWLTFVGSGIDVTTITVNVNNPGGEASNCGLLLEGNGYNEITGITFNGSQLTAFPAVTIWSGPNCRIHHCKFLDCRIGAYVAGPFGVLDHNEFVNCHVSVRVYGRGNGQFNWATYYPIPFNSLNYLFIEDNLFSINANMSQRIGDVHAWVSSGQGSSYVVRYNTFTQARDGMGPCFDWHGDNNDGTRGNLSSQIYGNTFSLTGTAQIYKFCDARGGQGLVYNNSITCRPGYGGAGISVSEEHPLGTLVAGLKVFDAVTNQWQWGNTINGAPMGTFCGSATGCAGLDFHDAVFPGEKNQTYPHPLAVTGGAPPSGGSTSNGGNSEIGTDGGSGSTGSGGATGGGTVEVGSPGSIRIIYSSMSISEKDVSITVTFLREFGSSGPVSVAYATSDGTALAGTHYTSTSGTVSWASGDSANKTIEVPVSNLGLTGSRSFTLALSNPTGGASLGSLSATSVIIVGSGESGSVSRPTPPKNLRVVETF